MDNQSNNAIPVVFDNLSLNLSSELFKRIYGVSILFKKDNTEDHGITYEIKIVRKYSHNDNSWDFQIDKKELRINNEAPNLASDEIAQKCWRVFYPLDIKVNDNWIHKTIVNIEELNKRWVALKKEFEEDYIDEVSKWYISEFDKSIKNPLLLQTLIDQDIFLAFYFAPLYRGYTPYALSAKVNVRIPIVPKTKAVFYELEQNVLEHYSYFNSISIKQKGKVNDERSAEEIVNRKGFAQNEGEPAKGDYSAQYELDKDTKTIQSIIADCSIRLPYNEGRSVHLEAYYLSERDHELINEKIKK
jgi:hypothetical protein